MSSPIRHSTRVRKARSTIYDEAKAEMRRATPKRKKDEDSDDDESTTVPHPDDNDPNLDDNDSDNESTSSSSSSSSSEAPIQRKKSPVKIHVQYKPKKGGKKTVAKPKGGKGAAKTRLLALKNKTLDPKENSKNSLTAAIFHACLRTKTNDDDVEQAVTQYPNAFLSTDYTQVLEPVAKKMLASYQSDPNRAHVTFLNFLFRSVGGSYSTALDPETVNLEDMDDDQWEQLVTSIVDDMRHTPYDAILISSCKEGAVHAHDPGKHNLAQEEYRRIFDHFWYLLGTLSLSSSSTVANNATFDIEQVRDLANKFLELVTVGQPDLRSAACQATLMLALAACDGTLAFQSRLATAKRQLKAATAAKTVTKQKALEQTVAALERSCDDLEHVVTHTIVPGVFMRRYRDSDPYIRAFCLDAMSQMTLRRPDIFLKDIYLKYYGWMMSDKHAVVRVAAIKGLLLPFHTFQEQKNENHIHPLQVVHLDNMSKVLGKFLPRASDCVVDVSAEVQQEAVKLLVALMQHGFMDDVEDEGVWNRINLRALAPDATPAVRKNALYFVLEQLEAYDVPKNSTLAEAQKVFQIDSLAVWVAHAISDGRVPIEHFRVHLTDYVVQSLRDMPEHSHLVTDWSAMIKAIQNDTESNSDNHQRVTAAKQRVLLHMLATAAALEFESPQSKDKEEDDGQGLVDEALIRVHNQLRPPIPVAVAGSKKKTKKGKSSTTGIQKERLTIGLLKALPQLLEAFKENVAVLRSLTSLPRFFVASVVTLPQRKKEVQALINLLGDLFVESTDATILQNTCLALTVLAKGDHARNQEALLKLKSVAATVQDRLFQLFQQDAEGGGVTPRRLSMSMTPNTQTTRDTRNTRDTAEDTTLDGETDELLDQQHAILLCLRRLRILSKKWYMGVLLARDAVTQDESTTLGDTDPSIHLCSVVAKVLANEMRARNVQFSEDDDDDKSVVFSSIWADMDPRVHRVVAAAVGEGLQMILAITAWRLRRALNREKLQEKKNKKKRSRKDDDESDGSDSEDDLDEEEAAREDATVADIKESIGSLVRSREGLVKLLILCFDTHVEDVDPDDELGREHLAFSNFVQLHATKIAADLRTLFPKEWSECKSPVLRACALREDTHLGHLVGGSVRFFRSKTDNDFEAPEKGRALKEKLLLPLARGLCVDWEGGNRREAGMALSHIVHPNEDVSRSVAALNRVLKKLGSVRLVESHMACLRENYSDWVEAEPEEPETDRPSEQEMVDFAAAERDHEEAFKVLEHKATRLSASLGVGKLSEQKLYPALFGFLKEGIRFAFSNDEEEDDEFLLGTRLAFLFILLKYLNWLKKKPKLMKELSKIFQDKEEELRLNPDFDEIREEDMEAVEAFSKGLGLSKGKPSKKAKKTPAKPVEDDDSFVSPLSRNSASKRRLSTASSVRSGRSSTLSPLMEESDDDDDDIPIETLKKRRRDTPQATIKEASDEDDGSTSSASDVLPIQTLKKRKTSTPRPAKKANEEEDDDSSKSSVSTTLVDDKEETPTQDVAMKESEDEDDETSATSTILAKTQPEHATATPMTKDGDDEDDSDASTAMG